MNTSSTAPKKGTGIWWLTIGAILLILHFTNPGFSKHAAKGGGPVTYSSYLGRFGTGEISNSYHDCFFFSTTENTFGILGMVF